MGDLFKIFRKCCFCRQRGVLNKQHLILSIESYRSIYYHQICLNEVLRQPGHHAHQINIATQITRQQQDEIKNHQRLNDSIQKISTLAFSLCQALMKNDKNNKQTDRPKTKRKFEEIFKNG